MIYNFTTKLQKEKFRAPIVEDIWNNYGTRAALFFLFAADYSSLAPIIERFENKINLTTNQPNRARIGPKIIC